jgi:putative transposase
MGATISRYRPELAAQLGTRRSFLRLPEGVRRIIYATKAIEALNSKLRRAVRTRGQFPNDDAALKLFRPQQRRRRMETTAPRDWFEAKTQFAVVFGERFGTQ